VWDVATQIDSLGWTAEFRIPLSQLRFSQPGGRGADLGVNFMRDIARYEERSWWSPWSRSDNGFVSELRHADRAPRAAHATALEVRPYTVAR
jgi:hypothetical protein